METVPRSPLSSRAKRGIYCPYLEAGAVDPSSLTLLGMTPYAVHRSPFTAHYLLLTPHRSLLTATLNESGWDGGGVVVESRAQRKKITPKANQTGKSPTSFINNPATC